MESFFCDPRPRRMQLTIWLAKTKRWLSGSAADGARQRPWKRSSETTRRAGATAAPDDPFGVFDCASHRLIGFIEVNLARVVSAGEHTSELQSRLHLVCRLLLEK